MRKCHIFIYSILCLILFVTGCSSSPPSAGQDKPESLEKIRFAVAPFLPSQTDTKNAYEPFVKHIADQLGVDYELSVTNDWAGIAVALSTGQADVAWMGPWSYVLSHAESGTEAIATVKYDGKPTYQAIIVANPALDIQKFPEDAKGKSISFADVGSTSGWLIPSYYFKKWGIDQKSYFLYSEGASHPANEVSVAEGHIDLATDYDRNRNAMIESGVLKPDATKIVWTSDPLPNDPIVVRSGMDENLKKKIQEIVVNISEEQAKMILPNHYTGFIPSSHEAYQIIEEAGIALGKIKK